MAVIAKQDGSFVFPMTTAAGQALLMPKMRVGVELFRSSGDIFSGAVTFQTRGFFRFGDGFIGIVAIFALHTRQYMVRLRFLPLSNLRSRRRAEENSCYDQGH
jgi:hypothetical protein